MGFVLKPIAKSIDNFGERGERVIQHVAELVNNRAGELGNRAERVGVHTVDATERVAMHALNTGGDNIQRAIVATDSRLGQAINLLKTLTTETVPHNFQKAGAAIKRNAELWSEGLFGMGLMSFGASIDRECSSPQQNCNAYSPYVVFPLMWGGLFLTAHASYRFIRPTLPANPSTNISSDQRPNMTPNGVEASAPPTNALPPCPWESLRTALLQNDSRRVSYLLKDRNVNFNLPDAEGNLPIHYAARLKDRSTISKLLVFNQIDSTNKKGQTPLHIAAEAGNEEVVADLLAANARFDLHAHCKVKDTDFPALTPLQLAVLKGHEKVVKLLLPLDWHSKVSGYGNILHLAIHFDQNGILKSLLKLPPNQLSHLLEDQSDQDRTPLMEAAFMGNVEAILLLQKIGVPLEAFAKGRRAIHWAVLGGQKQAFDLLYYFGCSLEEIHSIGSSLPLQVYANNLKRQETHQGRPFALHALHLPESIVFKGGSVKGVAYIGVIEQLEAEGLMEEVKRFAGTSAGAITVTLLALGFTSEQVRDILTPLNLMEFFDHPLADFKQKTIKGITGKIKTVHQTAAKFFWQPKQLVSKEALVGTYKAVRKVLSMTKSFATHPIQSVANSIFGRLKKINGICEGERLRLWVESLVHKKTGKPFCTFGELRALIAENPSFKHLHVFATNLNETTTVDINSEDSRWDSIIISDAIRASTSIPGIFKAHHLHMKDKMGRRIALPETYVDGGLLKNFPVTAFDKQAYLPTNPAGDEKERSVLNKRTLGFCLVDPEPTELPPTPKVETVTDLLKNILSMYGEAEALFLAETPENQLRTIKVSNQGVGVVENLTDEKKKQLIQGGKEAVRTFAEQQRKLLAQHAPLAPSLKQIIESHRHSKIRTQAEGSFSLHEEKVETHVTPTSISLGTIFSQKREREKHLLSLTAEDLFNLFKKDQKQHKETLKEMDRLIEEIIS
ncbi:MAG: patatin-like phospholipase family protein [Verrucomicrobiota bacterium]|nr:patatin-like phospholipase family protein [Verrucomicrobiota bacterium]